MSIRVTGTEAPELPRGLIRKASIRAHLAFLLAVHVACVVGVAVVAAAAESTYTIGLAAAVGAAVGAAAAAAVERRVRRPIVALAQAVDGTATGESGEPEVPAGPAEIRQLAQSVNWMRRVHLESERTLERAAEQEHEAAARLRELNELKDGLLTGVSHAMRTPLTSVVGFAATLRQRGPDLSSDAEAEIATRLDASASRLEVLLGDLGDVEELTVDPGLNAAPVEVADVLAVAIRHVDARGRRIDLDEDAGSARLDVRKVERLVAGLVANGVRRAPPGTAVEVASKRTVDGVVISVADHGPAVPDAEKHAAFEPFSPGRGGPDPATGVGLALVALIAHLHGGHAWTEDRPGGGAVFSALLREAQAPVTR